MKTRSSKDKYVLADSFCYEKFYEQKNDSYIFPSHTYRIPKNHKNLDGFYRINQPHQKYTTSFKLLLNDKSILDTDIRIHSRELIAIYSNVDIVKAYYKGHSFLGWGDFKNLKFFQPLQKDRKPYDNSEMIYKKELGYMHGEEYENRGE